jgi:hypothetical protein
MHLYTQIISTKCIRLNTDTTSINVYSNLYYCVLRPPIHICDGSHGSTNFIIGTKVEIQNVGIMPDV